MTKITDSMRKYSSKVVDGIETAPARSMLRAVGFTDDDFKKPQIGIASTWANVTPCNMHINKLAEEAEKGANAAGGKALIFNTITVSDGIANGTEGMKYSLVSREVIADSIETVVGCEGFDGVVAVGGCGTCQPVLDSQSKIKVFFIRIFWATGKVGKFTMFGAPSSSI